MRARTRPAAAVDAPAEVGHHDKKRGTSQGVLRRMSALALFACFSLGGCLLWARSRNLAEPPSAAVAVADINAGIGRRVQQSATSAAGARESHSISAENHAGETLSVAEALSKELQACRAVAAHGSPPPQEDAQILESLRCVFKLIYPPEETEAATYGLHTAHPENIYGEIPPESVMQIASELGLHRPGSVFYDLGSGVGRMVLQVYLTTQATSAVGVEIALPRHEVALHASQALKRSGLQTLLPNIPEGARHVQFLAKNITEIDMSDATGVYLASLYFPKEIMWMLAEKLAQLKSGTRILTLVKFPFDTYGRRKLPKDSPMQALRLRKSFSNIRMTWSEENNVFLYEVDREEAFPAAFDASSATNRQLLDEAYKRARIQRLEFETPEFAESLMRILEGLKLSQGDEFCEVGTTTGWLSLNVALESKVDKVFGASVFDGDVHELPGVKAKAIVDELSPGRIPWHRRVEFLPLKSLESFISGRPSLESSGTTDDVNFVSRCQSASVVLLHPMRSYEDGLDALAQVANVLQAGTIILAVGMDMQKHGACCFGLLPLLERQADIPLSWELNLTVSLDVFAVAPSERDLSSMYLPGMSNLSEATSHVEIDQTKLEGLTAQKILQRTGQHHSEQSGISQASVRDVIDMARFARMYSALSGITVDKNGTLSVHAPQSLEAPHHLHGALIPAEKLARLWLARFLGGMDSAYACLEANVYALASYAPAITKREKKAGLFPEHSATYGEVDPRGLEALLGQLGGLKSSDVFFDLGSGLGKAVLQVFASSPAARIVGVELSEARHRGAEEAFGMLQRRFPGLDSTFRKGKSIELLHADVLKADLRGATFVWMGSLAFPRSLMEKIGHRLLEQASVGCRVVTMIEFPPEDRSSKRQLRRREDRRVHVRWSKQTESPVYVYEVIDSS